MFKKIGLFVFMGIIMALCSYSIYLMYKSDTNYKVTLEEDIIFSGTDDEIYMVTHEDIVQSLNVSGSVMPVYAEEMVEVYIEGKPSDVSRTVQKGDTIGKGTVYATYKGKEYKADSKMYCVEITDYADGVKFEFIDYGKLFIEIKIPEKYAAESLYNREITITCNEKTFSGNISFLSGYCFDGCVNSKITYNSEEILLRPGTECSANIIIQQKEDVMAVPLEYVIYSEYEDQYRLLVAEGERTISRTVEVGIIGDKMVEIISGVSENDYISLPRDEMSLKYYLNNSQGVSE